MTEERFFNVTVQFHVAGKSEAEAIATLEAWLPKPEWASPQWKNLKPHWPVDSWGVFKDERCADCFAWDLTEDDPLSRFVWFAADKQWECQRCGERTPQP